jgi:hypothetical protein
MQLERSFMMLHNRKNRILTLRKGLELKQRKKGIN